LISSQAGATSVTLKNGEEEDENGSASGAAWKLGGQLDRT
jgi:hypothetical protein